MKEQKKLANKLKQNKAITLIALVITIIVLLILAGVAISAISGNENTMDKAQKAKADNEKADELDTIKLAVVDAVAMGSDGRVSKANLVAALRKIPEVVSASNVNDLETNGTASGPWTVIGQKGSYEVTASGTVTKIKVLSLTESLKIPEETVQEITVTKSGSAADKQVSWSKTGNVTFVTSLTDTTEVASPTGETVYVKAGALTEGTTGSVTVSATGEDSVTCNITISKEIAIGDSVDYTTSRNGTTLDNWKVFYKEGDYVYLIYGDYMPNGAVGTMDGITTSSTHVTKGSSNRVELLNAMNKENWDSLLTGTLNEGTANEKEVSETRSTNVWAMGCPTLDLYVNSWNAKYPSNKLYKALTTDDMSDGLKGYYVGTSENPSTYNVNMSSTPGPSDTLYYPHAFSAYGGAYGYWLASPSASGASRVMYVHCGGDVSIDNYNGSFGFRPVVCLPSSVLE